MSQEHPRENPRIISLASAKHNEPRRFFIGQSVSLIWFLMRVGIFWLASAALGRAVSSASRTRNAMEVLFLQTTSPSSAHSSDATGYGPRTLERSQTRTPTPKPRHRDRLDHASFFFVAGGWVVVIRMLSLDYPNMCK
eukprot:4203729-Amphidinium_carterae.1